MWPLFLFISVALAQDYCGISPSHTLCQYSGIGPSCGRAGPVNRGLTPMEKRIVVDIHNRYRSRVASGQESRGAPGPQRPASNMLEFTWDDELEFIAQTWADQCQFGHDSERSVARFSVGQNVYEASDFNDGPIDLRRAIDGWYNEVEDVNNNLVDRYQFVPSTGHYTQMVWANSYKIGCGYTSYRKRNFVKKFIVCNYGDAGNLLNTPMYRVGRPCSKCPANICSRRYPGLCPVPGETSFPPLNSTLVPMVDIDNNIDNRPQAPARPVFVPEEVEVFQGSPEVTRPVEPQVFRPRPVAPQPNFVENQLFPNQGEFFSARPAGPVVTRPRTIFERLFGFMG